MQVHGLKAGLTYEQCTQPWFKDIHAYLIQQKIVSHEQASRLKNKDEFLNACQLLDLTKVPLITQERIYRLLFTEFPQLRNIVISRFAPQPSSQQWKDATTGETVFFSYPRENLVERWIDYCSTTPLAFDDIDAMPNTITSWESVFSNSNIRLQIDYGMKNMESLLFSHQQDLDEVNVDYY